MYGESCADVSLAIACAGLSPRVRGIPESGRAPGQRHGSIPACTGNPCPGMQPAEEARVYPRVYGESPTIRKEGAELWGLSPRVRGIPLISAASIRTCGSIPACTGNPPPASSPACWTWVYPRVYGESAAEITRKKGSNGLSPRVRGIPGRRRRTVGRAGSIPACTGNPNCIAAGRPKLEVYPRVYGESTNLERVPGTRTGLSPRVRGIHTDRRQRLPRFRSIPACTGNPPAMRAAQ